MSDIAAEFAKTMRVCMEAKILLTYNRVTLSHVLTYLRVSHREIISKEIQHP